MRSQCVTGLMETTLTARTARNPPALAVTAMQLAESCHLAYCGEGASNDFSVP